MRTVRSGISRGTETLVFRGGVPPSQYAAMRAPFQEGDFPGPVKYGYLNVGVVEHGPAGAARPHRVLPLPAPDRLRRAGQRRDRRARRRAARRAPCWPAPSRPRSTRCGTPRRWSATGSRSSAPAWSAAASRALLARLPGRRGQAGRRRPGPGRASPPRSASASRCPATPPSGRDLVVHASATSAGLQRSLDLLAPEGTVIELSWYGDARGHAGARRRVPLRPAGASAPARSAPSSPARSGPPHARPTGWRSRWTCCATPRSTRCSPASRRFDELPDVMAAAGRRDACRRCATRSPTTGGMSRCSA